MTWEFLINGFAEAIHLILSGDPVIFDISLRSVKVSGIATLIACLWGLPLGVFLSMHKFRGKGVVKGVFNALLGIPTVVLGLILYLFLVPTGPFGFLGLMYTELGISLGQSILIAPIIVSFTASAVEMVDKEIRDLAFTLGASRFQASVAVLREAYAGVILAIMASFNRAIAELGIAIIIGGNIFVQSGALNTRVLTTAIQMYTTRGDIVMSIALGVILLSIIFILNGVSNIIQRRYTRVLD